ncbi:Cysteine desulfurase IscS (plasmid) [Streptomyces sp. enrichment culture]
MTAPGGVLPSHPGLTDGPVYLDYNATTPVDPRVAEAMTPYLTDFFGNPSSNHPYAATPGRALAEARSQTAGLIGAQPGEIVFTGSGSEVGPLALRGAVLASGRPHPHVITQATEHPAVLETYRALERLHGARVIVLPVDSDGLLPPVALAAVFYEDTVLVSVMAANNETGAPAHRGTHRARPHPWGAVPLQAGHRRRHGPPVRRSGRHRRPDRRLHPGLRRRLNPPRALALSALHPAPGWRNDRPLPRPARPSRRSTLHHRSGKET